MERQMPMAEDVVIVVHLAFYLAAVLQKPLPVCTQKVLLPLFLITNSAPPRP